jgi:hypothetical protein
MYLVEIGWCLRCSSGMFVYLQHMFQLRLWYHCCLNLNQVRIQWARIGIVWDVSQGSSRTRVRTMSPWPCAVAVVKFAYPRTQLCSHGWYLSLLSKSKLSRPFLSCQLLWLQMIKKRCYALQLSAASEYIQYIFPNSPLCLIGEHHETSLDCQ